jgi:hypothetical protein
MPVVSPGLSLEVSSYHHYQALPPPPQDSSKCNRHPRGGNLANSPSGFTALIICLGSKSYRISWVMLTIESTSDNIKFRGKKRLLLIRRRSSTIILLVRSKDTPCYLHQYLWLTTEFHHHTKNSVCTVTDIVQFKKVIPGKSQYVSCVIPRVANRNI